MQKTPTVMNDLHRISDKIAENTRQSREAGSPENHWSTASATPEKTSVSASAAPSAPVPVPQPAPVSVSASASVPVQPSAPSALLERRYADFLRIRRDLLERLTDMSAKLQKTEKNCADRLALAKETLVSVQSLLNTVPQETPEKTSFADRSELSKNMLALENLRLETIRLSNAIEQETVKNAPAQEKQKSILLDSLTFRQIFRLAMIAALPFIIVLLVASLIVAAAVIGSFKGMF